MTQRQYIVGGNPLSVLTEDCLKMQDFELGWSQINFLTTCSSIGTIYNRGDGANEPRVNFGYQVSIVEEFEKSIFIFKLRDDRLARANYFSYCWDCGDFEETETGHAKG